MRESRRTEVSEEESHASAKKHSLARNRRPFVSEISRLDTVFFSPEADVMIKIYGLEVCFLGQLEIPPFINEEQSGDGCAKKI